MSVHQKREMVDEIKLDFKPKECSEKDAEMSGRGVKRELWTVKERRVLHIRE